MSRARQRRLALWAATIVLLLLALPNALVVAGGLAWILVMGFRRYGWARRPAPGWHPCEQCGRPIESPSRARFCDAGCRRIGRLKLQAPLNERARLALERVERQRALPAGASAQTDEIPF